MWSHLVTQRATLGCLLARTHARTHTYTHTHTHTLARTHACTHARTHARTHAHIHTHTHSHSHSHTRTHARLHARTHTHTHTHTLTLTHSHARTLARTHAHTHTHTLTLTHSHARTLARTHARLHTRTLTAGQSAIHMMQINLAETETPVGMRTISTTALSCMLTSLRAHCGPFAAGADHFRASPRAPCRQGNRWKIEPTLCGFLSFFSFAAAAHSYPPMDFSYSCCRSGPTRLARSCCPGRALLTSTSGCKCRTCQARCCVSHLLFIATLDP
jgi:hypothetical protein